MDSISMFFLEISRGCLIVVRQMKPVNKKLYYFLPILFLALIFIFGLERGRASDESSGIDNNLISRTIFVIQKNYLDQYRMEPFEMLKGALDEIQRKVPEIMAEFNDDKKEVSVTVDMASKKFSLRNLTTLTNLEKKLIEIFDFINTHYKGDTEKIKIEYAALDGLLSSLDPHSSFLPPEIYKEFKVGTKGEFGGLGIVISIKEGSLIVVSPLDDTPAARAGIKAGDRILQIGDESAINMSLTDAVNRLRGEVGTKIKLIIERPKQTEPITFLLTRALINIDSVQSQILEESGKKIGYLKVKSFQSNTDEEVSAAIKGFTAGAGKLDGLILDLRNNPGGLLNQAVELADQFLSDGIILTTVGNGGVVLEKEDAVKKESDVKCPVIALINEGSASASEIVAGVIKESGRGIIVGRRSFGKGSVQAVFDVNDDSAVKLTVAKYLPAGTYPIQSVGLTPDVELIPIVIDRKDMNLVEDTMISEKDLEKHFEDAGRVDNPEYRVKFVMPKEDDNEEKQSVREYSKKPDLKDDFAVNLSRQLIATGLQSDRSQMLSAIKDKISETSASEENKIILELSKLGIDWEIEKEKGKPRLKVAFDIIRKNMPEKEIVAGEEAMLELKATNVGTGIFSRLIGVGKSEFPVFTDKEFVFGKLAAGETRSWQVPVKIPELFPTEELAMEVDFRDEKSSVSNVNAVIPIRGIAAPQFGFSYVLRNENIKVSDKVYFDVEVKNTGSGKSNKDTVALLSNKSGDKVFMEVGRQTLGVLEPGASKKVSFRFHLLPDFNEKEIKLDLSIFDAYKMSALTHKVTINPKTGDVTPKSGKFYRAPIVQLDKLPLNTKDHEINIRGIIKDDGGVHDYFVFVGAKKVAYVSNPDMSDNVKFDIPVSLEPGNNFVVVSARDTDKLIGRAIIAVNRTSGQKKGKMAGDSGLLIPDPAQ